MRQLSLKPGSLAHHLNVLTKSSMIKSVKIGNNNCFYSLKDENNLQKVLTDIQNNILNLIKENPGISLSALSKLLNKNKMVINYNTSLLLDIGVIKLERKGTSIAFYPN
jgi:predicted transcriptional regulator